MAFDTDIHIHTWLVHWFLIQVSYSNQLCSHPLLGYSAKKKKKNSKCKVQKWQDGYKST